MRSVLFTRLFTGSGLVICLLLSSVTKGQISAQKWVNYSRDFFISDIEIEGNSVWVSSWGGLARYDKIDHTVTNFDGANSGLKNNNVTDLVVADNGVKWIGTQKGGLVSFDGTNWNSFSLVNGTDSITSVYTMTKDYNGNVWFSSTPQFSGSASYELYKTDGTGFVKYTVPNSTGNSNQIKSMACDTLNNLWIVTHGYGNQALRKFDGSVWTTYDTSNSAIGGNPQGICIDHSGNVWTLTQLASSWFLTKFDGTNFTSYPLSGTITTYADVSADDNNNIWVYGAGSTGLSKFNGTGFTAIGGLPFQSISAFCLDTAGNYFAGYWTNNDQLFYDYNSVSNTWTGHHLSNSYIDSPYGRTIAIDHNNIRWIATTTGALNRFDGTTWQQYDTTNSLLPCNSISSLLVDQNNELWIGMSGVSTPNPLAKFDGTNWQLFPLTGIFGVGNNGWVTDIDQDQSGNIWFATSDGIAKYDGNNWAYFTTVIPINPASLFITSITVDINNDVWATTNGEGIVKYDGNIWSLFTTSNSGLADNQCAKLEFDDNNNLWVSTNNGAIQRFDGVSWNNYPASLTGITYPAARIHRNPYDNTMWFCSLNEVVKYNGISWERFDEFNSGICSSSMNVTIDKYNNKWFSTWNAGISVYNENGINYEHIYNIPSVKIQGTVFYDLNGNGVFNTGPDHGVSGRRLFLLPDSVYTYSNSNGAYVFLRDSGFYEIAYQPDSSWFITSDSASFHVALDTNDITGLDFGTAYSGFENNLNISYAALSDRCSLPANQIITYKNVGTTVVNGEIRLVKDSQYTFNSSIPPPLSVSGDTITWDFQSLLQYEERQIIVLVTNPGGQPTGTLISSYAVISSNQTDIAADTIYQQILCSLDPNDKIVFPPGHGPTNEVLISDTLSYTIRFQNTGNDTAFFVMLVDTLSSDLDMNSFELTGYSHPVTVSAALNGIISFRFDNINLLWSSIDEPASHGFVKFRLKPKSNLQAPVTITNRASIFFDFNPAIVTNTTLSTMVNALTSNHESPGLEPRFMIYPNPTRGEFTVAVKNDIAKYVLIVHDITGKVIYQNNNFKNNTVLDQQNLTSGIYTVEIRLSDGNVSFQKLVICQ